MMSNLSRKGTVKNTKEAEEIVSDQGKLHEILTDPTQLQEEEMWQAFDEYMKSWEPSKKNIDSKAERAWQ